MTLLSKNSYYNNPRIQWRFFTKNQGARGVEPAEYFRSRLIFVEYRCILEKVMRKIEALAKKASI